MKIAICDDVVEYRLSLKCYVNEYFKQHNLTFELYEFSSGKELLNTNQKFDIVFLDIELGDSNGIDVAMKLQKLNRNTIILIVTSYRQYLDDAMDINVTRYIDKPITQKRIFSALDKSMSILNEEMLLFHLKDNNVIRIKASEIIYVEAKFKGVYIYTKQNEYRIKETIKVLRDKLNMSCFAVPHNSFIVNLNYVKSYKREELSLLEPYSFIKISIATRKQPIFKRRFLDFIGEDFKND